MQWWSSSSTYIHAIDKVRSLRLPSFMSLLRSECLQGAPKPITQLFQPVSSRGHIETRSLVLTHPLEWLPLGLPVHKQDAIHQDAYRYQKPHLATIHMADLPVTLTSWATPTNLSHLGRAVASLTLRLYFFSNRNCSFDDSLEKSGGHTFFGLKWLV